MTPQIIIEALENLVAQEDLPRSQRRAWAGVLRAARVAAGLRSNRGAPVQFDREEIRRRLAAGEPQAKIASDLGCSPGLVSRVKNER